LRCGPDEIGAALDGVDAVYVAFDCDVLDPDEEITAHLPEPGGLTLAETASLLGEIAASKRLAGAGLTGLAADPANTPPLSRLCAALGL
jgi:arginase family enzyme